MAKQRIVINLPNPGISGSLVKGLNKRLSYIENEIKKKKKSQTTRDISELKHQIKVIKGMAGALSAKEARQIKSQMSSISQALSSLGKIRIPSPS